MERDNEKNDRADDRPPERTGVEETRSPGGESPETPGPAEAKDAPRPERGGTDLPRGRDRRRPQSGERTRGGEGDEPDDGNGGKKYSVVVRYGNLRMTGLFIARIGDVRPGDKCVVRSDRGTELADALTESMQYESGDRARSTGKLVRKATSDDFRLKREIEEVKSKAEAEYCREKIKELGLPMKLAEVEHLFGGDKIIFYFLADGRVDFRQLVRELARQYRTRIEMKQIGVRDEAKLISDYEHCGRELCCRSFIKNLEPVTMRMAKNQKATLDPAKISGACGRLMCCLRFEHEVYKQLKQELPFKGSKVLHKGRTGEVADVDVLQKKVRLQFEGQPSETVHVDELGEEGNSKPEKKPRVENRVNDRDDEIPPPETRPENMRDSGGNNKRESNRGNGGDNHDDSEKRRSGKRRRRGGRGRRRRKDNRKDQPRK